MREHLTASVQGRREKLSAANRYLKNSEPHCQRPENPPQLRGYNDSIAMSRLDTTPITQRDLKDYLAATEDDFRLELEVYQFCKTNGLTSFHGGTYEDPITNKTRQFDARAGRVRDNRQVQMAIECKCLKPFFPLLILQTPRTVEESYHQIIHSSDVQKATAPSLKSGRVADKNRFYERGKFVGKSTSRVGRNSNSKEFVGDDSEVFDKWSQALSSAHDLIVEAAHCNFTHRQPDFFSVIIAVLVVSDKALWTVNFQEDGKRTPPRRVDDTTIYVGKEYRNFVNVPYAISHLHVVTLTGFKHFVRRLVADDDPNEYIWHELFPSRKLEELAQAG